MPDSRHTTKGHCKGILTWNASRIGWLIHSVPKFPATFTGTTLSPLDPSELIYGQSFCYIEQSRAVVQLEQVIRQILWMKPNLFHQHNLPIVTPYPSNPLEIKLVRLSSTMTHMAKSPEHHTDFIGSELQKISRSTWYEETWKRGSEYPPLPTLHSITTLRIADTPFTEGQDHSKWATTPGQIWMGDLNHMRSQEKRGGGGLVIRSPPLAKAFQAFVT